MRLTGYTSNINIYTINRALELTIVESKILELLIMYKDLNYHTSKLYNSLLEIAKNTNRLQSIIDKLHKLDLITADKQATYANNLRYNLESIQVNVSTLQNVLSTKEYKELMRINEIIASKLEV